MLEHLRGLREDRDISQAEMAELLNIHQTTYSNYELEKGNIPLQTLITLADFFHTSIDYLVGLTDERKPYPKKK